jgi:copper chaperone CopZ
LALVSVTGVTRAEVFLEGHEAHVEYDAAKCSVEALIAAVANAKDPGMPAVFRAALKKE